MIATEHIHANASTPNFPLRPFVAHVGSPSQLRIVGLPLAIGSWHITAVQVTANYPDNTSQSVNCVKTGNAWSATIPASAAPGMSKNGYLVTADGVDENNNPVSGYVLGMGDVIILNRDSTITVGETTYYLHLVDETPDNPHKGDVDITTGKVYDGTQWIALATLDWDDVKPSGGVPKTDLASSVQTSLGKADTALQPSDLDDAVTRTSANGVKSSGIWSMLWGALTALPAGFTSLYDWCVAQLVGKQSKITASGILKGDGAGGVSAATAGTDFQAPLSQTQLDNIAAVPNKADDADVVHLTGDETISGTKNFTGGIISDTDGTPIGTTGGLHIGIAGRDDRIRLWQDKTDGNLKFYRLGSWEIVTLKMVNGKTIAFAAANPTAGNLAALDADGNPTDSLIPAANVALKTDLRYAISESIPLTVTSGAASTTLNDRTHNVRTVAAPGTGNTTTITATLPPIVTGKSRDMFLNLTVGTQASDEGDISLSIVEPSGATVQIDIGSVVDIGIGKNEILIFENALPTTSNNIATTHWLVTVRHEDFVS